MTETSRKYMFCWMNRFLFVYSVFLLIFIARFVKFMPDLVGLLAHIYLALAIIGHAFFLTYVIGSAIMVPAILVWPKKQLVLGLGILVGTVGITAIQVDHVVYSLYRSHVNSVVLELFIEAGDEIFNISWLTWLVGTVEILGLVIAGVIIAWISRPRGETLRMRARGYILTLLVLFSIISSHFIHAWADAAYYRPITAMTRHVPVFYPLTAKHFLRDRGFVDLSATRDRREFKVSDYKNASINYPLNTLQFDQMENRYNILFVLIDCWRFDALTSEETPHIKLFVDEHATWNFSNHLSGGNGTRTGVFSLFYGLYGTYWNVMSDEQIGPVFIRELIKRDYQMGIFASANLTTPPFDRTVFNDIDGLRAKTKGSESWERDRQSVDEWFEWLEKRDIDKPFFGFLFFDSTHTYSLPPDYPRLFKPMLERVDHMALNNDFDPTPYKNLYRTAAHFVDSLAGEVLSDLKKRGLLDNTIIVFTGDHGEEFNDNKRNFWGHGGNYTKYQIQVPLVIYWPGGEEKDISYRTCHVDVVPTLMKEFLGCTSPASDFSSGWHLLDSKERQWMITGGYFNYALWETDRITVSYPTGTYEIFDPGYAPLPDAKLRFDVVKEAMGEISRFYQ